MLFRSIAADGTVTLDSEGTEGTAAVGAREPCSEETTTVENLLEEFREMQSNLMLVMRYDEDDGDDDRKEAGDGGLFFWDRLKRMEKRNSLPFPSSA